MHVSIKKVVIGFLLILSQWSHAGFYIQNGQLLDGNGSPFIMRGINHLHTWYPWQLDNAISGIASTGANSVRIVLSSGQQWSRDNGNELANIIRVCKEHKLIVMFEVHDSTGWPERSVAAPLSTAVDYWISSDIKAAIQGQEDYVLINIANEAIGNTTDGYFYTNQYTTAIKRMRDAGLTHTVVIDGSNWGQDWMFHMRDNAQTIFDSDSLKNTLFSIHMYEVFPDAATIQAYFKSFSDRNLPLVIGEFGPEHFGKPVDAKTIIAEAQRAGIGYLGWGWGGNEAALAPLNLTWGWNANSLTPWGQLLINDTNGIAKTSQLASIFFGSNNNSGNLARGKAVTWSSSDGYAGDGNAAVDGNPATRWASEWSDPQWIYVDLGAAYNISRVVLNWEAAYASDYIVEVSDDAANWTTIHSDWSANGGIDTINVSTSGRYVRMWGNSRATQWGYSLWEFEVYGSPR